MLGWIGRWVAGAGQGAGLSEGTMEKLRGELDRCGCWLKRRRLRPNREQVDGQLRIKDLRTRGGFHAKSSVAGVVRVLRGFGDDFLQQGVWTQNPMRWVRGPRLDLRSQMPRRMGRDYLTRLWDAARRTRCGRSNWGCWCIGWPAPLRCRW